MLAAFAVGGGAATAGAAADEKTDRRQAARGEEVVALVGDRFISRRDVELAWSLAFERVQDLVRRNKIRVAERTQRLQKEWTDTIKVLVQEQLLFQRPAAGWARYRTPVKDLWMCGSGTHPGGGIMGAPGELAAKTMLSEGGV